MYRHVLLVDLTDQSLITLPLEFADRRVATTDVSYQHDESKVGFLRYRIRMRVRARHFDRDSTVVIRLAVGALRGIGFVNVQTDRTIIADTVIGRCSTRFLCEHVPKSLCCGLTCSAVDSDRVKCMFSRTIHIRTHDLYSC